MKTEMDIDVEGAMSQSKTTIGIKSWLGLGKSLAMLQDVAGSGHES